MGEELKEEVEEGRETEDASSRLDDSAARAKTSEVLLVLFRFDDGDEKQVVILMLVRLVLPP